MSMGFAIILLVWYVWHQRKELKKLKAKGSGD
jgi:hypothetical protein